MANLDGELRNDLREAYDRKALERESYPIADWKIRVRQDFLALLQAEQKRTLLELGAGPGRDARFFQDNGLQVTCVDLSAEMVELCRQKGLAAEVMDCGDLRFAAESFEAVYALNCLLHLPKHELPSVLRSIDVILKPAGVFYLGVYGGVDHEGVWQDDTYEPKRFFSFFVDEQLQQAVTKVFEVLSFQRILLSKENSNLHFQSLILRKRNVTGSRSTTPNAF
ncbi:demethylmenaquinone methyltransferase / 2-methoxy-6-polyprenyl-1,4-benzoquinol methylase [Thermoflexales bacterium]|nr:demethylmenaquinone methyltransferase / 2-methoxy-6-polyprenyl-1,4-benzoquinol methylase [Thermoflexales bacterium]